MTLYDAWVRRHRYVVFGGRLCYLIPTGPWLFHRGGYFPGPASWETPVTVPASFRGWGGLRSKYR